MEVAWNQQHAEKAGLVAGWRTVCGRRNLRRDLHGGRHWNESLETLGGGASVPNTEEFVCLIDAAVLHEDAVGHTEIGINGPFFLENAAGFSNLSHSGAGCIRSVPEGTLSLFPAPCDCSCALPSSS